MRVAPIQLADTFDLLQSELQQLLLPDDIEMAPDPRVFSCEALDFRVGQMPAETHVQLAGEVVVEFGEELDVEEEDGGGGELIGDYVEEDFGTVVFVLLDGALLGADCEEPHFDQVGPITEEDAFTACLR